MNLEDVAARASGDYDLSSLDEHRRVRDLAEDLLQAGPEAGALAAMGGDVSLDLDLRLASKLALSKRLATEGEWALQIGIVYAMWGEQRRLLPRSSVNPTGEDSLHAKLDQLDWLFDGSNVDWRLYAVDDGDPGDSATVAQERAIQHRCRDQVEVLRLADAISDTTGPLAALGHVDESRKGGAIIHGASVAVSAGCDAIVMTDADNSVDLGQVGLLVDPFERGADVVVGDRKHPHAVLVKAEARWGPGIVVLRHMQRTVGRALFATGLRDTQAAFKLYNRGALEEILAAPSTYGFAFDSDWLSSAVASGKRVERVPFAFVDSFEESASITQGPMTTWESLLRGLVDSVRARGLDHDRDMAQVIDDYAVAETLERVVEAVPPELADVPDADLGDPGLMPADAVRKWIQDLQNQLE